MTDGYNRTACSLALFTLLLLIIATMPCRAQWLDEVALTDGPRRAWTSYANARGLAVHDGVVHAVIMDERSGCWQPYYLRSTDGGGSWSDAMLLCDSTECYAGYPAICNDGANVYVAWYREEGMDEDMYMRRSSDNGATWSAKDTITSDPYLSRYPSITADGDVLHLACAHKNVLMTYSSDVFYMRSSDRGLSWDTPVKISDAADRDSYPCVCVAGDVVHVAWYDNDPSSRQLYYARSTDGGTTWEAQQQLTTGIDFSASPTLVVDGAQLFIVYQRYVDRHWQLRMLSSSDAGENWGNDHPVVQGAVFDVIDPSMTLAGGRLHLVWTDNRAGNYDTYYAQSDDGGETWSAASMLCNDLGNASRPMIAVEGEGVHVMWSEERLANADVYYRCNPTGDVTAIAPPLPVPARLQLLAVYPNPADMATTLTYQLSLRSAVTVDLYDLLGRQVARSYEGMKSAGVHALRLQMSALSPGNYLCRVTAGSSYRTTMVTVR